MNKLLLFLILLTLVPISAFAQEFDLESYDKHYRIATEGLSEPNNPNEIYQIFYQMHNGTTVFFENDWNGFNTYVHTQENGVFELKIPLNYPYTNSLPDFTNWDFFEEDSEQIISNITKSDCFATLMLNIDKNAKIRMMPFYIATDDPFHGDPIPEYCLELTNVHLAPDKQKQIGIENGEITCKEGLEYYRYTESDVICVKPTTKVKLIERGWPDPICPLC